MTNRWHAIVIFIFVCCLIVSCSSTIKRSVYKDFVQSYSKDKPEIKDREIGVLPFECIVAFIGESISQNTTKNLLDIGSTFCDSFELSQRLKQTGANYHDLVKNKYYKELMSIARIDYLIIGDVQIYSPRRKRIISATAHMLNADGDVVLKVRFEPPNRKWSMPIIGKVLATEIKSELAIAVSDTLDLRK